MAGRRPCGRRRLLLAGAAVAAATGCSPVAVTGAASLSPVTAAPAAKPADRPMPAAAPSSASTASSRRPTGRPVTIAFAGDVHFAGSVGARLAADPATAVGPMSQVLRHSDLAIANLETAITTRGTPAAKQYVFRAPPTAIAALEAAGIDLVTEANNHGMDYGVEGLRDSIEDARAVDFPVIGIGLDEDAAFAPYRATISGQRIAVIGATQVLDDNLAAAWTAGPNKPGLASAKDVPRLLAAVRAARTSSDTLIVYLHWGTELHSCPTDRQRDLAGQLIAAGADVVVGSHAHVLLGAGYLNGAYVDYGLGNFLFYVSGGAPTAESGVLTLTVRGRAVVGGRWDPARILDGAPRPLTGAAATRAIRSWQALRGCAGLAASPGPGPG